MTGKKWNAFRTVVFGSRFFTLIELLLVVAIIAILAGMLLPALNNARVMAKTTACQGNIKQVGQVILMYGLDNKDIIVPGERPQPGYGGRYTYRGFPCPAKVNAVPWTWWTLSYFGVKSGTVTMKTDGDYRYTMIPRKWAKSFMQCPAINKPAYVINNSGTLMTYRYINDISYGMVAAIGGGPDAENPGVNVRQKIPWYFNKVKRSGEHAMLTDSVHSTVVTRTYDHSSNNMQGTYLVAAGHDASKTYISTRRHGGKSNVVFSDGHVQSVTRAVINKELAKSYTSGVMFWAGGY